MVSITTEAKPSGIPPIAKPTSSSRSPPRTEDCNPKACAKEASSQISTELLETSSQPSGQLSPCFEIDKLPPNATMLEYIPNLQQIELSNFSEQRLATLREILNDIHQANVLHGDAYPRNMMVSVGESGPERVLWIDFDSAQTFPEGGELSPLHKRWIGDEVELVDYFVDALVGSFFLSCLADTASLTVG